MITKDEIFKNVAAILNETFEIPLAKIKLETRIFEDLDLDSIDAVDLIVKLQNHTSRKIDPEIFKKVRTVGDVVDAIYNLMIESNG
jgi:acyl carrier protein